MINPTNFKLGIGLPCSWPHVSFDTVISLLRLERPTFELLTATNGPVDGLRNQLVADAMACGCSHLIMMDMDQTYPVDTVTKLLAHKLPVVGCMVHRRYPPFDPLLYKGEIGAYELVEGYEDGDLVEVDATGTGCLMFDMKIFRDLPAPWFKFRLNHDGRPIGEDFGLCSDLRKAGYKIYVDTSIKCGHLSLMKVTQETEILYRAMKNAQKRSKENGI